MSENKLKVGDKVLITTELNCLNNYMAEFAGMEAVVTGVIDGSNYGQIATLDIDGGEWQWSFEDKLDQISKL
jgi:hypothetical protein